MDAVAYALAQALPADILLAPGWSTVAPLPSARYNAPLARLSNGTIFTCGGSTAVANGIATSTLYDPVSDTWTDKADMPVGRMHVSAVPIKDGLTVLAVGGSDNASTWSNRTFAWDSVANTWAEKAQFDGYVQDVVVSALSGGALVVGGQSSGSAWVAGRYYDPVANTWTQKAGIPGNGVYSGAASETLAGGAIVLSGGYGNQGAFLRSTRRYTLATNTWDQAGLGDLPVERNRHRQVTLSDGRLATLGGSSGFTTPDEQVYITAGNGSGAWASADSFPADGSSAGIGAAAYGSGRVLLIGQNSATKTTARSYVAAGATEPLPGRANLLAYLASK